MDRQLSLSRADFMNSLIERLDKLEKIGVVGPGGDILIDAEEAAALSCLDKDTILFWGQTGKIPRYKIGGAVRFGLRDFCSWIASCRQPSLAEKKAARQKTA